MKFDFKTIKKVVINLKRREDRLFHFKSEMDYIGWDFDVFEAIDTNSYIGCALSHVEIAKNFLNTNEDYLLVLEDDISFMPYAKSLLDGCNISLNEVEWDFFHLAPSIHRPVNKFNEFLCSLSNLPPRDESKHRGVFGTSGFIITKKSAELIINWDTNKYLENSHRQKPIDVYLDEVIYPNTNSFCPKLPIVTQINDFSNINQTFDRNHYLMTYNWNVYFQDKLDQKMLDFDFCINNRE